MARIRQPSDIVIGQKYGLLTVTGPPETTIVQQKNRTAKIISYPCICDCGKTFMANQRSLLEKEEPSCGCTRWARRKLHSKAKGFCNTKLYGVWNAMISRCENPNCRGYHNYGGRGISVCDEWKNDFLAFKNWAEKNGYCDGLTLERINNNGNYEPNNCSWKTKKEQNNNRRTNRLLTFNDITHTIMQWSEICGVSFSAIVKRLDRGWSIEDILTRDTNDQRHRKNKELNDYGRSVLQV